MPRVPLLQPEGVVVQALFQTCGARGGGIRLACVEGRIGLVWGLVWEDGKGVEYEGGGGRGDEGEDREERSYLRVSEVES